MDEATVKSFRWLYGIEPLLSSSKDFHMHPHLAYERSTLEQRAHKLAAKLTTRCQSKSVFNVGAAPSRVCGIPNVRCLVPQLQPGDAGRLAGHAHKPNVCTHTLQECLTNIPAGSCKNCVGFGCSVFTHSIYYIPPQDIIAWLKASDTHTLFAVCHTFPGGSGGFHQNEASWYRSGNEIVMTVVGNTHQYRHPDLPWQGAGFSHDGDNVDVELIGSLGCTNLYSLTLVPYLTQSHSPAGGDWTAVLTDSHHTGPIHIPPTALGLTQSTLKTELIEFDMDTLRGNGDFLYVQHRSKRQIIVPRGLVATVALRTALKPRDPALVATARAVAHQYLENTAIPIELKPAALVFGVALGLCINVRTETALMNEAVTGYSGWFRAHSRIVNLIPLPVWGRCYIPLLVATLVLVAIAVGALATYDPTPDNFLSTVVICSLIALASMALLLKYYYENLHTSSSHTWNADVREAGVAGFVSVPVQPPKSERGFPGTTNVAPPLPVPTTEQHSLRVGPDPRPLKNPGNPPDRVLLSGIAISTAVPTVVEPNQKSEISGITNRILVPQPVPDSEALEWYDEFVANSPVFRQLDAIRVRDDEPLFEWWVRRYPQSRQQEFRDARNNALDRGFVEGHHKGRAFVKQEKKVTKTTDGDKPTRPRMVTAFSAEIIACSGPYLNRYSTKVAEMWRDAPIVYTRGLTADRVGQIVAQFVALCGGWENVFALENDFKTMDATIQPAHTWIHESRWEKSGATPITISALHNPDTVKLSTPHGVKAKAPSQVSSGQARTNLIDSQVNAGALGSWQLQAIERGVMVKTPSLLLVMGDDGILFLPRSCLKPDDLANTLADDLNCYLTKLAFKPVPNLRLHQYDMEFCSKLFWPVADGLVLGPKPGRILARIGWSLTAAGAANLSGAIQSLRQDCCFIPFLGPFLQKLAALTRKQKVKKERGADEWMYHTTKYHVQTDETWQFFTDRYGLTRHHETDFIKILDGITSLPAVITYEPLDTIIKRDD